MDKIGASFVDGLKLMISSIFGAGLSNNLKDILTVATSDATWQTIKNIYDSVVVPIGVCVLMMIFCHAIIDKSMSGEGFTFEIMAKMLIKLILMAGIMISALDLAEFFINLGNMALQNLSHDLSDADTVADAIIDALGIEGYGSGVFQQIQLAMHTLPYFIMFALPWVVSVVCNLIVRIMAITREIEIYIRTAFLPIALGDVYNGPNSGGIRYVKGLLAVCLQGLSIVLICYLTGAMYATFLDGATNAGLADLKDIWNVVVMGIVYKVAQAGLVAKSLSLCREACGVYG